MAGAALRNSVFVPSHERTASSVGEENAREAKKAAYFTEMEKRIANIEAGQWTEHELIEVDDA